MAKGKEALASANRRLAEAKAREESLAAQLREAKARAKAAEIDHAELLHLRSTNRDLTAAIDDNATRLRGAVEAAVEKERKMFERRIAALREALIPICKAFPDDPMPIVHMDALRDVLGAEFLSFHLGAAVNREQRRTVEQETFGMRYSKKDWTPPRPPLPGDPQ